MLYVLGTKLLSVYVPEVVATVEPEDEVTVAGRAVQVDMSLTIPTMLPLPVAVQLCQGMVNWFVESAR